MNIKQLNEAFKDLNRIGLELISEDQSDDYYEEKEQGSEGIRIKIYKTEDPSLFLKVVETSDSYGDNKGVKSIQFVTAKEETKIVYE